MKEFFGKIFASISVVLVFIGYFVVYGIVIMFFFSIWEFIIRQPMYPSSVWDIVKAFFEIWWELINEYIFWSLNPVNWYKWFISINWF